ncbi:MAG: hypothetical protein AAF483_18370 [Planctomycetota bacterium]
MSIEKYLQLSEDELLIEIGRTVDNELGALPPTLTELSQRGKSWLADNSQAIRVVVCPKFASLARKHLGFSELAAAIGALLESQFSGTAWSPLAVYICKVGVTTFCPVDSDSQVIGEGDPEETVDKTNGDQQNNEG